MPKLDAAAKAAVESAAFAPAFYCYFDILGDPLRFTTFGADTIITGSGDAELDGTYPAFGGQLIDIGDVANSESGSDTLTVTLSGIVGLDSALLAEIGDRTQWQGRTCRIWFRIYDETGVTPQGAIVPLYTGYMSAVRIIAEPETQTIQLSVENWLAAFNQPSNRSYLNQKDYDAADTSAQATIAASNGMRRDSGAVAGPTNMAPNNGGNPDTSGFGAGGGVATYSPYPDAPTQSVNPDYTDTSKA